MGISVSKPVYNSLVSSSPLRLTLPQVRQFRGQFGLCVEHYTIDVVVYYSEIDENWYDMDGVFYSLEEVVNYCTTPALKNILDKCRKQNRL